MSRSVVFTFLILVLSLPAIAVCDPTITLDVIRPDGQVGDPVVVYAKATSGCPVTAMDVDIDYKLTYRQFGQDEIIARLVTGPGPHRVIVKAWNSAGAVAAQERFINTLGSLVEPPEGCNLPPARLTYTGNSIDELSPPDAKHTSPVRIGMISNNPDSGASSMRLYIDGVNRAQVWGTYAWCLPVAHMHLKLGYHFITVQAWDYQGKIDLTGSIVQVVNTVDCPLPGSPGVHICTPADGLTFAQKTLTISASAAAPSPIKVMELWIDGSKRQVWLGVNQINYTAELSPGVHSICVWAIDQNNQKYNQTVTATIEATN